MRCTVARWYSERIRQGSLTDCDRTHPVSRDIVWEFGTWRFIDDGKFWEVLSNQTATANQECQVIKANAKLMIMGHYQNMLNVIAIDFYVLWQYILQTI